MTIQEEKKLLKKQLDEVNDVAIIRAIKQLLEYAHLNREKEALKPFTKDALLQRAKISNRDIKNGHTTGIKQLRKDIETW